MPGLQVAPSSGQNWLSSSPHGGATERCQVFKWRHLPDKTGYHHHHMVAPLSGARYSSGAIFRTKLVIVIIMVAPLRGAERDRSDTQVAPLSGADSSGAIFRIKLDQMITWWRQRRRKTQRDSSGAIFRTKLVITPHHMVAPLSGARRIQVAPSGNGQNWLSSSSHGGATER